jgi:hypothetical protein
MNTRHKVLDWFELSRRVIALHPVLMYYAIEIGSSLFLLGSFRVFQIVFPIFPPILNIDLSSLFIVEEPPHRV